MRLSELADFTRSGEAILADTRAAYLRDAASRLQKNPYAGLPREQTPQQQPKTAKPVSPPEAAPGPKAESGWGKSNKVFTEERRQAAWSKRMVAELGEGVGPHLRRVYAEVLRRFDESDRAKTAIPAEAQGGLPPSVSSDIAKGVTPEVVQRLKPREAERVIEQIAEIIERNPRAISKVPEILEKYQISPDQLGKWLREGASSSGRFLGEYGRIGKLARQFLDAQQVKDPALKKALEEVAKPRPSLTSWEGLRERIHRIEDVRRALMVAQWKTAVRNAITQGKAYSLKVVEDAIQGTANWKVKGMPREQAFAEAVHDIIAVGRRFSEKGADELAQLIDRISDIEIPERDFYGKVETVRLLESPISDLTIGGRIANIATTFTRTQEMFYRKLIFDATVRGKLAAKGYKVDGPPSQWNVPAEELAKAAEFAVSEALERTFAAQPKGRLAKDIMRLWHDFPVLNLIQPYPRFYFVNAMRFIYEYSPAGFISPKLWRDIAKGDTKLLTRAAIGTTMVAMSWAYRRDENAPRQWYKIPVGGGKSLDVRPFAPFSTYLFLGEILADVERGLKGKPTRLSRRDYVLGALGMNRIAGTGLALVDAFAEKNRDFEATIATAKEVAGNYLASFLVPMLMARDLAATFSEEERKIRDIRGNEITGSARRMIPGLARTLPAAPAVTRKGSAMISTPLLSQLTGLSVKRETPVERELFRLGIHMGQIRPPSSGVPEVDRRAAELMGERLPDVLYSRITSQSYRAKDDAQKADIVLRILDGLRNDAAKRALGEARLRKTKRVERLRGAPRTAPNSGPLPLLPLNPAE